MFEWRAVVVARFLAGRMQLPPLAEQKKWEADRLVSHGDGQPFYKIAPDFAEYFEKLRSLARPLQSWDAGPDVARMGSALIGNHGSDGARHNKPLEEGRGSSRKDT